MRKRIHIVCVEWNYVEPSIPDGKLLAVVVKMNEGPLTNQFCSIWKTQQSHDSGHHITLKAAVANKGWDLGHLLFFSLAIEIST